MIHIGLLNAIRRKHLRQQLSIREIASPIEPIGRRIELFRVEPAQSARIGDSDPRTWGLKLKGRIGFKRTAVSVAGKLAVMMHATLRDDTPFLRVAKAAI